MAGAQRVQHLTAGTQRVQHLTAGAHLTAGHSVLDTDLTAGAQITAGAQRAEH